MLKKVSAVTLEEGVYVVNVINTLIVAPPLIINEEQIDQGIHVLDNVLKIADKQLLNLTS